MLQIYHTGRLRGTYSLALHSEISEIENPKLLPDAEPGSKIGRGSFSRPRVSLVQTMLGLNKKLHSANIASEKTMIQRQIDATDRQSDKLVYELYGLNEEEIEIVEEATAYNFSTFSPKASNKLHPADRYI